MAYKKKIEQIKRCPFEYGLQVFGGKWNARILCLLSQNKPLRFHQIRDGLSDITDAVLSGTLHELLSEEVIRREAYNEVPPRVEYRLTEKGATILPILQSICRWSRQQYAQDETVLLAPCRECPHRLSREENCKNS